jgi:hypothetical protein
MIKSNYFSSNIDILQHFDKFIPWNEIVPVYENNFNDANKYSETGNELYATAPNNLEEALEYYRTILDAEDVIALGHDAPADLRTGALWSVRRVRDLLGEKA